MVSYKLVMPEHLNEYDKLFGGNLLKWVDETAWMAVSLDYAGQRFVTIGMNRVEFRKSVSGGSILRIVVVKLRQGTTSVTYQVDVSKRELKEEDSHPVFSTEITFVCVNKAGQKTPIVS